MGLPRPQVEVSGQRDEVADQSVQAEGKQQHPNTRCLVVAFQQSPGAACRRRGLVQLLLPQSPAPSQELEMTQPMHDSSYACHLGLLSSASSFAGNFEPRCHWDWHRPVGLSW